MATSASVHHPQCTEKAKQEDIRWPPCRLRPALCPLMALHWRGDFSRKRSTTRRAAITWLSISIRACRRVERDSTQHRTTCRNQYANCSSMGVHRAALAAARTRHRAGGPVSTATRRTGFHPTLVGSLQRRPGSPRYDLGNVGDSTLHHRQRNTAGIGGYRLHGRHGRATAPLLVDTARTTTPISRRARSVGGGPAVSGARVREADAGTCHLGIKLAGWAPGVLRPSAACPGTTEFRARASSCTRG